MSAILETMLKNLHTIKLVTNFDMSISRTYCLYLENVRFRRVDREERLPNASF